MNRFAPGEAIAEIWKLVDALNGYVTEQEPWALAKDPAKAERLATVLHTLYRGVGTLAVLLAPVLPEATAKLWTALGAPGRVDEQPIRTAWEWTGGERVAALEPLFPRVEA